MFSGKAIGAQARASMTEELAFEQLRRRGRAVHFHERPLPSFAVHTDGAPIFAFDEHGGEDGQQRWA